jgi:hypothetical protein
MRIKLLEREFAFYLAWEIDERIKTKVKLELMITKKCVFTFVASVPNKSFSSINPFKALMMALESQTVGMIKYDRLKDRIKEIKQWQKL